MSTMIGISRLTPEGIEKLWEHVSGCREDKVAKNPARPLPVDLLSDARFAERLAGTAEIDLERTFDSRFEFGKYICDQFGSSWNNEFLDDPGLWAWLAVAYWDQFTAGGVSRHEHYVPLIGPYSRRLGHERLDYRSCARTPVMLFKRLGEESKFFLTGSTREPSSMATMGDLIEQVLSRQDVYGNDRTLKMIMTHFSDAEGRVKAGTTAIPKKKKLRNGKWSKSGYGKLRRLVEGVLPRLKLTYNVNQLNTGQIIALTGPEFTGQF